MTTVPKLDPEALESTSSMYSLSDAEVDLPMLQESQAPVAKRKGGRKPVCGRPDLIAESRIDTGASE